MEWLKNSMAVVFFFISLYLIDRAILQPSLVIILMKIVRLVRTLILTEADCISFLTSCTICAESEAEISASREYLKTESTSRAGWPIRTTCDWRRAEWRPGKQHVLLKTQYLRFIQGQPFHQVVYSNVGRSTGQHLKSKQTTANTSNKPALIIITHTLFPILTAWSITSTTVVVLPVPGGPWMMATSGLDKANTTARRWLTSRAEFTKGKAWLGQRYS